MFNSHQLHRFAIRKYAIGVCSVMVASLLFLGTSQVSADQLEAAAEPSTEQVAASPDQLQDQELEAEPAEIVVEPSLATPLPAVDSIVAEPVTVLSSAPVAELVAEIPAVPSLEESPELAINQAAPIATNSQESVQEVKAASKEVQPESAAANKEDSQLLDQAGVKSPVAEPVITSEKMLPEPPKLAPAKFTQGIAVRSVGTTRSATPAGVIGDDYPAHWKYADPDNDLDTWRLYVRNCTSFVGYRLSSANKFELPPAYGNAKEWGGRARSEGYRVDNTPVRGAVAWSEAAAENEWCGHVAWVSAVNGDMVTVEEYNYGNRHAYNVRTVHKSAFTGYIHFKDLGSGTIASPPVSSIGTTHGFPNQGSYTFKQRTGIKNSPSLSSPDRGTYEVGETVNYDRVLESDNHVWLSYINFSGIRSYVAVKALTSVATPAPSRPTTGTIQIQKTNNQTGDFDVIITNVYHSAGVREVQVPIWSDKGGQDDIVWYKAQYQGGSTYKVSVKTSQHKNDTGTYHVHLYYVQDNGKQHGAGATTTQVSRQTALPIVTPAPSLPSQGTYRFTKTLPIKSQAKMSSVTIDYYYAGETVNYDRVLTAEGRQWISYLSHGGARRYIPLN